ncbi:MAG TPA: AI-2E family transporter [Falsiroseomonas sp.]|jgi:predicted PurR-regulated permease PerM|nr:AI-2E family transporter [Falsiroseomonas sp.]
MVPSDTVRNRLLAVIVALMGVAALRWSYPVTMPLVAAVFVIAAAWPIKEWLDRTLPPALSTLGTAFVLLLIFAGFIVAIYFAAVQVVATFVEQQARFRQLYDDYAAWARPLGLPVFGGTDGYDRLLALLQLIVAQVYAVLGYLGVIAVLVILGMPEAPVLRRKLRERLGLEERRDVVDAVGEIAGKFRSYVGVTTFTSLLTGLACGGWAWAMGLDLALVWGVLNFLLNFIPVIGNIIGIVPPTLYALIQFENWTTPLVIFAGYTAIQVGISNFVYPWLQGRGLSLSPAAVIVALAFWGWLWGFAGALLAVPLTAATVIICAHFSSTEWIAALLSGANGDREERQPGEDPARHEVQAETQGKTRRKDTL